MQTIYSYLSATLILLLLLLLLLLFYYSGGILRSGTLTVITCELCKSDHFCKDCRIESFRECASILLIGISLDVNIF